MSVCRCYYDLSSKQTDLHYQYSLTVHFLSFLSDRSVQYLYTCTTFHSICFFLSGKVTFEKISCLKYNSKEKAKQNSNYVNDNTIILEIQIEYQVINVVRYCAIFAWKMFLIYFQYLIDYTVIIC